LKEEISVQKEDLNRLKKTIETLEKELEETKVELTKAKIHIERIITLEEANDKLKGSLFELADEYSRDLPEIFNNFDKLTKEIEETPTCDVSLITVKEFGSVDKLIHISTNNFFMISRNSIQLLRALIKHNKENEKRGKVQERSKLEHRRTLDTRASPRLNSHEDEVEDDSDEEIKEDTLKHIKANKQLPYSTHTASEKFPLKKSKSKRVKTSASPKQVEAQIGNLASENYSLVPAFNDIAKRTKGYFTSSSQHIKIM